jgi:hypothetical protein
MPTKAPHLPNAQTDSVREGSRLTTRCGGFSNTTAMPRSSSTEMGAAKTAKENPRRNKTTPTAK